jgi:hypothetical protein
MFDTSYSFRHATTKHASAAEFPLIKTIVYTFKNDFGDRYIVNLQYYDKNVYVIKFHAKSHSLSESKYNLVINKSKASRTLKTIINISLEILNSNENASFAFLGAFKFGEEDESTVNTQRYRIYKSIVTNQFGTETFTHTINEVINCYLLVNNKNSDPENLSKEIVLMFSRVFKNLDNL